MQLDYRILWFDDQEDTITPSVERVRGMISRLGFEPKIELRIITGDVAEPLANLPTSRGRPCTYGLETRRWSRRSRTRS